MVTYNEDNILEMLKDNLVDGYTPPGDVPLSEENRLEWYRGNDNFRVASHSDKDIHIIKYRHLGVDWTHPWTLSARGIVLNDQSKIVSRPYKKFFNYRELNRRGDIPSQFKKLSEWDFNDKNYIVYEKLDGSLCTVFNYENEVIFSSSGSLEGEYPSRFRKWFNENLNDNQKENLSEVTREFTLLFEYISPDNRIVIPYQEEDMVLHGVVHTETGKEVVDLVVLTLLSSYLNTSVVSSYKMSLDEIIRIQKDGFEDKLGEGFVVRFSDGRRLKFKTEEYFDLHSDYTLHFGKVDSKRKIQTYIDMIDNGTIDDLIGRLEALDDEQTTNVIQKVISLDKEFREKVEIAKETTNKKNFTKKNYALTEGTKSIDNKLVLNIHKENTIDNLRRRFIGDYFKEGSS